jgi:exodeoxyribonuclease VIII
MDEVATKESTEKEALEVGLYKNLSFDDYTAWEAVNASTLNGFSRTPAHVHHEMLHGGKERTPSLDLGWLVHLAVLEPDRFKAEIIVPPKVDRRTKVGKATWAQFQAEHAEKIFVDADTFGKVKAMAASLLQHETAAEFFQKNPGHNEVSVLWDDIELGIRCKSRIDRVGSIGDWPIVGDLKTARDAARRPFERSIYSYGYHVQAAHYLAGLETLYPVPSGNPFRRFVFFVVESEPPYCCAAYELDDAALDEGELIRNRYLRQWIECNQSGQWPGYPPGIDYASLPAWAFKIFAE